MSGGADSVNSNLVRLSKKQKFAYLDRWRWVTARVEGPAPSAAPPGLRRQSAPERLEVAPPEVDKEPLPGEVGNGTAGVSVIEED